MQQWKSLRHQRRIKETIAARISAVMLIAAVLLMTHYTYKKAYAGETEEEEVIVIPVKADGTASGDEVSGNNGKDESKEKDEPADPVVKVTITEPSGWYRKSAEVKFSAEDISGSEDFVIKEVRAKIGQSGSWTDVTDTMALECSENCVVYVEFTDTKGRTYSKNKKITCFDSTKPTLNAAVNNGSLTVETNDNESGVKAVYVNGFEFTNLTEGTLNIRMQQFDTGYESFSIQAMDYAGNMSDTYRVNNPYYKAKDASGKEVKLLPDSAEATKPAEATATVTDHIKTDEAGNALASGDAVSGNSKSDEKKKALAEADSYEKGEAQETVPGKGREFYTIEAKSGKVFYLIIDRNGEEEKVHFVTDITENDLLNVTDDNKETLPQNAAMTGSGAEIQDSALPNNNLQIDGLFEDEIKPDPDGEPGTEESISADDLFEGEAPEDIGDEAKESPLIFKILLGLIVVIIVVTVRSLNNMVKKRDGVFSEEEDPEDEDPGDDDTEYDGNVDDAFYDEEIPPEPEPQPETVEVEEAEELEEAKGIEEKME